MTTTNNPAGRLHALLSKGQSMPNAPASESWAELLGVENGNHSLLLRRVGQVMSLPSTTKEAILGLGDHNPEIYLKWLPVAEQTFGLLNFQMQWKQFIERFTPETMYGIEVCSDILSKNRPEKIADDKLLSDLLGKIDELLSELEGAELKTDVWLFIYDHLLSIKEAIEEYPIQGIKPLEAGFEKTVGCVVLSPGIYYEAQQSPVESNYWEKFWTITGRLALVVTVAVGSIQIGKDVVPLLPSPENKTKIEQEETERHEGGNTNESAEPAIQITSTQSATALPPPS